MDWSRFWEENIPKCIKPAPRIGPAMERVIALCQRRVPHPLWAQMRSLDYERDLPRLTRWLTKVLKTKPPADDINALWFGIFDCESRFYVAGSKRFSLKEKDLEWAVGPEYWPRGRYAPACVLAKIGDHRYSYDAPEDMSPRKAEQLDDYEGAGGILITWAYVCLTVAALCRRVDRKLLLGERVERHVTVGFDEGGFLWLGTVTRRGWKQCARPRVHG